MGELRASAGKVDLRPQAGQWMTGYGGRVDPAEGTHDPIMARAVALDDGSNRLVVVACDLLGFSPAYVETVRKRVRQKIGLPEHSLLIACTHTHSGPASMPMRGQMGMVDNKWLRTTQMLLVNLICDLIKDLEPARLAWGTTRVPGIGFNRQDSTRDVDTELVALTVERPDGSTIATIVNYATHAVVLGPQNLLFSGDFPGAVARQLDEMTGGVGLYLQGACGDVDPVTQIQKGWGRGTFQDCEDIGKRLAHAAIESFNNKPRISTVAVNSRRRNVQLPLDPAPSLSEIDVLIDQFKREKKEAAAGSKPDRVREWTSKAMLEWARALRLKLLSDCVPTHLDVEVYVARINELRMVGLPFETYTDIGLGIKQGVKSKLGRDVPVMFVGYANGLYGYCPTTWAKEQGGYGADVSCRWFEALLTPIGRGADDVLIGEGASLASEL